jgi:predicted ester cyclase
VKKMNDILGKAKLCFDARETGKGWEGCKAYCHPDATFSAQAGVLSDIDSLQGYTEWMKNLLTPVPDGRYELRFFAVDKERDCVAAYAVFHGTQTGPGGPGEPTGKTVAADYVYAMQFEGSRIRHVTKIWNDTISLQQLGWA